MFITASGLWFAALFSLSMLAIRGSLLEQIVLASHIDLIVPNASPPLGMTSRLAIAAIFGAIGFGLGRFAAQRIVGGSRRPPAEFYAEHPAPAHDLWPSQREPLANGPPRRPIRAHEELRGDEVSPIAPGRSDAVWHQPGNLGYAEQTASADAPIHSADAPTHSAYAPTSNTPAPTLWERFTGPAMMGGAAAAVIHPPVPADQAVPAPAYPPAPPAFTVPTYAPAPPVTPAQADEPAPRAFAPPAPVDIAPAALKPEALAEDTVAAPVAADPSPPAALAITEERPTADNPALAEAEPAAGPEPTPPAPPTAAERIATAPLALLSHVELLARLSLVMQQRCHRPVDMAARAASAHEPVSNASPETAPTANPADTEAKLRAALASLHSLR